MSESSAATGVEGVAETVSGQQEAGPYQFFMLVLCLFTLGVLAISSVEALDGEVRSILDVLDFAVCCVFLVDFMVCLWKAENRRAYFLKWGWLDLLSSVPSVDVLRLGRAARILRIFRVLRGIRASRIIAGVILKRRSESILLAAILATLLVLVISSVGILEFERDVEQGNIKTADDALWWSFVTMTTVGYGDRYPVTGEGRFVAALLMIAGVGLFGTFTGLVASWFVSTTKSEEEAKGPSETELLRREVARLAALVESTVQPRDRHDGP